jgi:hypothetical protein
MKIKPIYIVDVIAEVVADAAESVLSDLQANEIALFGRTTIETVNYQKGHKIELIETLREMSSTRTQEPRRYPCIYLVQDFREDMNPRTGIYCDVSLSLIIMHHTDMNRKVDDRYTKVFVPVLYPLYGAFMQALAKHPLIQQSQSDKIEHNKTDRVYWGRQAVGGNNALALTDYLDAIEISNLNLSFYFKTC